MYSHLMFTVLHVNLNYRIKLNFAICNGLLHFYEVVYSGPLMGL